MGQWIRDLGSRVSAFLHWLWRSSSTRKPWVRRVLTVIFVFALPLPVLLLLVFRFVPVPGTPEMLLHMRGDRAGTVFVARV